MAVLGQVRFSPILLMDRYVPEIQDELRRNGFPGYRQGVAEEVTWRFPADPSEEPVAETSSTPRWEFSTVDGTWRIVLTNNAVTLATSAYIRYEDPFEIRFKTALAAIDAQVGLQIVTRLGLRYVDLVQPAKGESFEEYLQPWLLGRPPASVGLHDVYPYVQTKGRTDAGYMIIRCVYTNAGYVIPPDLLDLGLPVKRTVQAGEAVAILDLDHFFAGQLSFDVDGVMTRLADLHDSLDLAFRNSVTDHALEKWGAETAAKPRPSRQKGRAR